MTMEDLKTEIEVPKSGAPEPKPDARRRKLTKIGSLIAGFAAVGTVLAGLTGYWTTYRTVTKEILAPVAGVDDKLAKAPRYSLVVLPFANVSGDSDQDYFAQGLTIDLTTDLSHYLSGSFVIAPTTAFTYKGKAVDPKQIGRELGVRYVLEGSVQRVGETITVNAQLISTESGAQIWAVRLDGERSRLDELRAEFVSRLTRWMGGSIVHAESLRAMRERPNNPDATDLVMRGFVTMGFSTMETYTPENVKKAIGIFDQALRLDPDKENALVGKATCQIILLAYFQIGDAQEVYRDVEHAADRVLAANPFNPGARRLKAIVLETRGQYDAALAQLNAAIESNPNFGDAYAQIGEIMTFLGRPENAIKPIEKALRFDPRTPHRVMFEFMACRAQLNLAEWDQAIQWCEKSIASNPALPWPYLGLAGAYGWLGRADEASAALAELQKRLPGYTVEKYLAPYRNANPKLKSQIERFAEGLRKAGLPER